MPLGSNVQRKFYIARNHEEEITSFIESKNVSYIESGHSINMLWSGTHLSLL